MLVTRWRPGHQAGPCRRGPLETLLLRCPSHRALSSCGLSGRCVAPPGTYGPMTVSRPPVGSPCRLPCRPPGGWGPARAAALTRCQSGRLRLPQESSCRGQCPPPSALRVRRGARQPTQGTLGPGASSRWLRAVTWDSCSPGASSPQSAFPSSGCPQKQRWASGCQPGRAGEPWGPALPEAAQPPPALSPFCFLQISLRGRDHHL